MYLYFYLYLKQITWRSKQIYDTLVNYIRNEKSARKKVDEMKTNCTLRVLTSVAGYGVNEILQS